MFKKSLALKSSTSSGILSGKIVTLIEAMLTPGEKVTDDAVSGTKSRPACAFELWSFVACYIFSDLKNIFYN